VVPQPQKPDHPRGHDAVNGSQMRDLADGRKSGRAAIPATGMPLIAAPAKARPGQAAIPGLLRRAHHAPAPAGEVAPYQRHQPAPSAGPAVPGTAGQRAFIEQIAPGAMATQQKYGVPASVTIAQAIDESGWGQSLLASQDHNLFGIKGSGPAGSDLLPTQEFIGGQLVDSTAPFRVYYDIGQSIEAHGKLLARSDYFTNAMANRHQPNAFAQALTGVYATDPSYGATLISLMQRYDLYRFDAAAVHGQARTATGRARTATGSAPTAAGRARTAVGMAAIPGITGYRGAAHEFPAWPTAQVPPSRPAQHPAHPARSPQPGRAAWPTRPPVGTPGAAPTPEPPSASPANSAAGAGQSAHTTAAAANQASDPAAAVQSTRPPRQGSDAVAALPSAGGHGGRSAPGPRPADNRSPAHRPASAHGGQRSGSGDPGRATEAAVPGIGPPALPPPPPGAGSRRGTPPGQADIPGLPYPAAAPSPHRDRIGPRVRPAHPSPGARRAAAAQPETAARPSGVHPRYSPLAPERPGNTPVAGQAGSAVGHRGAGRVRQAATVGAASIPGLPDEGPWQVASTPSAPASSAPFPSATGAPAPGPPAGPATSLAENLGDVAIPGLLPEPTARGDAAHGPRAARPGGTWVSGLPGAGRHGPHGSDGVLRGAAAGGAPHGTNLPPTEAHRLPSGGEPPGARGQRATPLRHRPAAGAVPASAPHSADQAPPAHALRSASRAPASAPGPAVPSPRPAAPPAPPRGGPASAPAGAAGTTFGTAAPDPAPTGGTAVTAARYGQRLPPAVGKAFLTSAKVPLIRSEALYVDVAGQSGLPWQMLAACDWMQCRAKAGLSPVYGEKLGTVNPDGTCYRTRSAALERCSYDLAELAWSVYQIDLTRSDALSVCELANVFAAFRWGGLLREHHTSAMEFPYSVEGLTHRHMHMRWPNIDHPEAPDKPGAKFNRPFGALPIVLSLDYPATA
jgi:hypothetical protein